jgi:hypothetical protein
MQISYKQAYKKRKQLELIKLTSEENELSSSFHSADKQS